MKWNFVDKQFPFSAVKPYFFSTRSKNVLNNSTILSWQFTKFFQNSMKFNSLKVFYIRGHKEKKTNIKLVFDKNVKSLIAYVIPK